VVFQEVVHSALTEEAEVAEASDSRENRMDTHKNAPLTPKGREAMVRSVIEGGLSKAAAADRFNTTAKTVAKWVGRFRAEGVDGLRDRSSKPLSLPSQTAPAKCAAVEALRRQRHTGKQIAAEVGVSPATVSRILRRLGLNRIHDLEPAEPVRRYEREHPGELIHIDIKKLGKFNRVGHRITNDRTRQSSGRGVRGGKSWGAGWEFVHVCIDDASRIAFSKVMASERKGCAVAFLKAAIAYYASLGVKVERVMSDNGACYKSLAFQKACKRLGLKHIRTKPYTPKTNGKAERFIQTSLREWAYARAYNTSYERAAELPRWLHRYNWHRPHAGIKSQTPISRLGLTEDNLLRLHI
jgi:transposase InsO family protein